MSNTTQAPVSSPYEGQRQPRIRRCRRFYRWIPAGSQKELFEVEGQRINEELISDYQFFHYNAEQKTSSSLGDFHPVFINDNDLIAQVNILLETMGSITEEQKRKKIEEFLFNFYGKLDKQNLADWITYYLER